MKISTIIFTILVLAGSTVFGAMPPIRQVVNHLNSARALLEQPNVGRPKQWGNRIAAELSRAMSSLESVKNNKGTYLPSAKKALQAAQKEFSAGTDDAHVAKTLEFVIEAQSQAEKAWNLVRG